MELNVDFWLGSKEVSAFRDWLCAAIPRPVNLLSLDLSVLFAAASSVGLANFYRKCCWRWLLGKMAYGGGDKLDSCRVDDLSVPLLAWLNSFDTSWPSSSTFFCGDSMLSVCLLTVAGY